MNAFSNRTLKVASENGFHTANLIDLEPVLNHPLYQEHLSYYERWIYEKKHAEMGYLERGLERRKNPQHLLPSAKSIFGVAVPYPKNISDDGTSPRYARYLFGPDYHEEIKSKLEEVATQLRSEFPQLLFKVCVDTSALLERTWAQFLGLGWIGKNTLLIHPKLGSYFFLGFILFSEPSDRTPELLPNYCGHCTKCLTNCPTQALEQAGTLNSNKCIAYLTLEKRGPFTDEQKKLPFKRFIAGCDICQEVCPYNLKPVKAEPLLNENTLSLNPCLKEEEKLLNETESDYKIRIKGTALSRIKYADFKRNLEVFKNQK